MADTVSGAAIANSLDSTGWTFLPPAEAPAPDALHVSGAAFAGEGGPSLLVEFSTLSPDWQGVVPGALPAAAPVFDPPSSVSAGAVMPLADSQPAIIAGALRGG